MSFAHASTVQHFKQKRDNFVTINVISKCANLLMTIPSLGERRHFQTLNTLSKVRILILECFGNLSFSLGSIVEHFKQESDNFVTINVISKCANLLNDSLSRSKTTFSYTKYTHESPNSDFEMFWKLDF